MTNYTLSVSTDDLGLGVLASVRVVVDRLRATASDQYPPVNELYRIEQATDDDGLCDFQLKFDDISTYHRARVFDSEGVPVYSKVFLMPAEAINLQDTDNEPPSDVLLSRRVYGIAYATGLRGLTSDVGRYVYASNYSADTVPFGGGFFYWDEESTADDDGGSVFKITDVTTGRWIRAGMETANVRFFGGIGDGYADDTAAMKAAFDYAIDNNVPMYIPAGCFLTDTKSMTRLDMPTGSRFVMFGDGHDSIIRVNDGQIETDYSTVFRFETDGADAIDRIEVRDIFIDNNATGSASPSPSTAYQHSHTFYIAISAGGSCQDVRFENVTVTDPAADIFNNCGEGGVYRYSVIGCSSENRTRSRADIQFVRAPQTAVISDFIGSRIESELDAPNPFSASTISISNSSVDILELAGRVDHDATYLLTGIKTKSRLILEYCRVIASGCDFVTGTYGAVTEYQRFNLLASGSRFSNTTFLLNYTEGTGVVACLYLYNTTRDSSVTFTGCRFEINYSGSLPIASGEYLLKSNASTFNTSPYLNSITVDGCWFDPRCYASVDTKANSASNEWILRNNVYGGVDHAIRVGGNSSSYAKVVVDGGDFSSVVNTGFYFSASSSSSTTLNLSGTHVGSRALAINGGADSMSNINYRSIREVLSENTPSEGFIGDRWVKPTPAFGGGWVYVCTSGSYLGSATWRMVSQFGVKKDTTANRPSVSSIDSGLMYLDTTISANGKAIWYTGTSWVNESGTVV